MAIGIDRVQLIKRESAIDGGTDGQGGPFGEPTMIDPEQDAIECCGIFVQENGARDEVVAVYRDDSVLRFSDIDIDTDLYSMSKPAHESYNQLIHFLESGPGPGFGSGPYYCEASYVNNIFPSEIVWYRTSSKAEKVFRIAATWTGINCTQLVYETFDELGTTVVARATDSISYSGVIEINRTRTIEVF